jgi:alcohol dehydrogenase class IV
MVPTTGPHPAHAGFVHDAAATRVVFAPGALARVPEEVDRLGAGRVLLISGGPESRYADRLAADLGGRVAGRVREVVMHVPVETARAAVTAAAAVDADLLVSVGGGSATGLAKAVARETGRPVLAVPTTYAGSEMTPIWGLTEAHRKTTGRDRRVLPRVVVYDPELTVSLPGPVSAASGLNALAHCVEGRYAADASPVTWLLAEEGIRALTSALPRVVADGTDRPARAEALYGAWLAGWTLGTAGMGIHHKLCHVLGGGYDLPHAELHAVILPYAVAYNATAAAPALARVAAALAGPAAEPPRAEPPRAVSAPAGSAAAGRLWDLGRKLGVPASLRELGFRPEAVDPVAEQVVAGTPANPRPVEIDGIRELLRAAWDGQRPAAGGG